MREQNRTISAKRLLLCYNVSIAMGILAKNNEKPHSDGVRALKDRIVAIIILVLVIAITAVLFIYRNVVTQLGTYGYLSAFIVSLISNMSVILPIPGIVILFALGTTLNPVLVGLVGATGGIFGEITGFGLGYGSSKMVRRSGRMYARAEGWMRRWGGWTVFVLAAVPLPVFDIAGLVAGALRYPVWKFLLIGWVGKSIKYVVLTMVGAWGWGTILGYFS